MKEYGHTGTAIAAKAVKEELVKITGWALKKVKDKLGEIFNDD